jgi:hypothetical protein
MRGGGEGCGGDGGQDEGADAGFHGSSPSWIAALMTAFTDKCASRRKRGQRESKFILRGIGRRSRC